MELNFVMSIINRDRRETMEEIIRHLDLPFSMVMMARGTATDEHLSLHGLVAREYALVTTVCDSSTTRKLMRALKMRMFIDIPGNGVTMAVPIKSVGGGRTMAYLTDNKPLNGDKPDMNFTHELIYVILNEGHSDLVMGAARSAGAGGGTVLAGKGTGSHQTEQFLGITITNEKEVVMILAESGKKAAIMKAINQQAGPDTKARAICFSLPVTEVAGLRQVDPEDDGDLPDKAK